MSLFGSAHHQTTRARRSRFRLRLEWLEDRTLLSGLTFVQPDYILTHPSGPVAPLSTSGPTGTTPVQIRHAYGIDQITLPGGSAGDGTGTTIAIVDAFDDPNIASDLHQFDLQFGLPDPTFTKVNQTGCNVMPAANNGWASEIALDVEWAHAIAPKAKILLVEANDNWFNSMLTAVSYAAHQPGVVAVSMSWGGGEDSTEASMDNTFLTPNGHSGVTFVASSGDRGSPPEYPAISPNVLSIGGTTLNLDSQGNTLSEYGWNGSGGGISAFEAQPAYQKGLLSPTLTTRLNPDVAYDADPYTGFPVYDSFNNGSTSPWSQFGGTSDAAPQWAALIAIADQGRALAGKSSLDGPKQTLPMLYQFSAADYRDIVSGSSLGQPQYSAMGGYDLVTGRGTPVAKTIVADLIGPVAPVGPYFSISAPASSTAGVAFSITVTALDQNSTVLTGYSGTVHFSSSDSLSLVPANYTFKSADNGVHTFTNGVIFATAGSETVTVTDTPTASMTGSATVSIAAANPSQLSFGQQPANSAAGASITPAVTVQVLDQYNNLVTWAKTGTVSVALGNNAGGGTLSGTLSATISNGIATFSNLSINKTGIGYTLVASSSGQGNITSAAFNILPGKASQLAFGQKPTNTPTGTSITPAVTVQVLDAQGNVVTNDSSDSITMALGANAAGGSLSGTLSVTAQNGVATFSNLIINKSGNGYTLVASGTGLTSITSATFNITLASTSAALASSANPVAWKQSVTFTATISGTGTPTGVVIFSDGGTSIGQGTLSTASGKTTASFSTSSLTVGNHTITASYAGDNSFSASTGTITQTVNKASTTTVVVSSTNPSALGENTTLTVTVSGTGNPTGVVVFSDDGTSIGQGTLTTSGGTATASLTTSTLGVGNHTITASYGGDANYAASGSTAITQTVNKASTTTAVASSASPSAWGQSVTFTATVTGSGSPTGVVIFADGGKSIGQGTLGTSGGKATASFTTSGLVVASHTLTASYGGDSNFAASTGTVTQTVSKANTATVVVSSMNPSVWGQSVTFTATVSISAPGAGSLTGTVQFQIDGSNLGSPVTLSSGQATSADTSTLSVSGHTITAVYSGDANFNTSTATLTQTVNPAASTTALLSSANPAVFGQPVTFTATVTAGAPGAGTPAGSVQFQIDGSSFGGPVTLNGGQATSAAVTTLSVGAHTIGAIYSGDTRFTTSSRTLAQQINPGPASILLVSGFPSLSVAGASGSFTVTVQDAYGNTVTGYAGTVHFSSSDILASLPVDYSFTATDNGVHTFSAVLFTAGTQSLTVSDALNGNLTGTQSAIGITAAAPDHIQIAPAVTTTVAGTPFDVSVAIKDAYNNTVTGYSGTVTFSSADPHGATLPADYTFTPADNGSHSFAAAVTLYKAGTWDVTITDKLSGAAGSRNVSVTPAPAVQFQVTAPSSTTPNTSFDVTLTALDPYLNVATNYQGTVAFSTTDPDPGVILPSSYAFTANDAGMHTFIAGITLVTLGDQTLSVSDVNGLTGSAIVTVQAPTMPPGAGGVGKGVGEGSVILSLTGNCSSAGTIPIALRTGARPFGVGSSGALPWLARQPVRHTTLLGIEEAIDLLFADGYTDASETPGNSWAIWH